MKFSSLLCGKTTADIELTAVEFIRSVSAIVVTVTNIVALNTLAIRAT
jgi:hypothetical protein